MIRSGYAEDQGPNDRQKVVLQNTQKSPPLHFKWVLEPARVGWQSSSLSTLGEMWGVWRYRPTLISGRMTRPIALHSLQTMWSLSKAAVPTLLVAEAPRDTLGARSATVKVFDNL